MPKSELDTFKVIRYSFFFALSIVVIFIVSFLLVFNTFFVIDESVAVSTMGPGQNNEERFPGHIIVVDSATVANLINSEEFLTLQTSIDGTSTIPLTSLFIGVKSSGGTVRLNSTGPRIAPGENSGDVLTLVGLSDTDKVEFMPGNGLVMSASVTLGESDIVKFKWDADTVEWYMITSDTK